MKLSKEDRAALHAGAHEFAWPSKRRPWVGTDYVVETSGPQEVKIRVMAIMAADEGWRVMARIVSDPVRLLAIGGGYTDNAARALRSGPEPEPEAVDLSTQVQITEDAERRRAAIHEPMIAELDEAAALLGRVARRPEARCCSRELWQAQGRLRAAINRAKATAQRAA